MFLIVRPSRPQLIEVRRLMDGGEVRPVIGSVFHLDRARGAFGQGAGGGCPGKVVLAAMGYTKVRDYEGGQEDWLAAGLPVERHSHGGSAPDDAG